MNEKRHPCDLCGRGGFGIRCPYDCAFNSYWNDSCNNYDCIYYNGDTLCNFGKRCGLNHGSDLDFDDEEGEDD